MWFLPGLGIRTPTTEEILDPIKHFLQRPRFPGLPARWSGPAHRRLLFLPGKSVRRLLQYGEQEHEEDYDKIEYPAVVVT
jgi:hypothetical protein